jgi:hypothetical protein
VYELINMETGEIVAEISDRNAALMHAAFYADKHGFESVTVHDDASVVLIEHRPPFRGK